MKRTKERNVKLWEKIRVNQTIPPPTLLTVELLAVDALPNVWISYDPVTNLWTTLNEVSYKTDGGIVITIPKGYEYDLASIPRLAWWAIAPYELGILSPLIHDYLYEKKGSDGVKTRKEADLIFLELMEKEGVSRWRRTAAYYSVRWGARRW